MGSLELWKVTVEYADHLARPLGASDLEWTPPRKQRAIHAAVCGDWGASQIADAGRIAVEVILGSGYDEVMWQPIVIAAEYVGIVGIQSEIPE